MKKLIVILTVLLAVVAVTLAQNNNNQGKKKYTRRATPSGAEAHFDLEYANVSGESLKLDLYLPKDADKTPPLVLWIHGGGWRSGDKVQFNPAILRLSENGYAVASINYRLGSLNLHPKQIHDCKGALRWLRSQAVKYGFDGSRVAVGGGSAGGHLALLLGLSGDIEALEGTVGGNLDYAGPVQAILDLYGPSDLPLMAKNKARFNQDKALLADASPLNYLDENDPPVLILHGDKDKTVPPEQSLRLNERYKAAGLFSELHILEGSGHGGRAFSDEERSVLIKAFLDKQL